MSWLVKTLVVVVWHVTTVQDESVCVYGKAFDVPDLWVY